MPDVLIDELLVFSDHHAHPFPYGSQEVMHNGVLTNSRLVDACLVLDQMREYADAHKIQTIVFGGDLFHTREAVSTDAYNLTTHHLARLISNRCAYLMVGNHDYFDREGKVHALEGLKLWGRKWADRLSIVDWGQGHCDLHERHQGFRGDAYDLCFVPYTEDRQLAANTIKSHADLKVDGPKLLFAHLGMQGAKVGSDYVLVSDGDIGVDDIPYQKFAGCLFGHFHQHQPLFPNGWYIGASHQHNWGDVNTKRGFLHVRVYIDHIEFEQIESNAARFIAVNEADLATTVLREKDFVKILTEKRLSPVDADAIRKTTKSTNCEVIYVPPKVKLQAVELDEKHLTPETMIATWVQANEPWLKENMPNVSYEELIQYGRAILAKVQEKHD